jgi:tungstate transport system ATP-binding protein
VTSHREEKLQYRLEGIRQDYGKHPVLAVDFLGIEQKSIMGVTGHNGSGKSTLLRILAFLESPAQGRVFFEGRLSTTHEERIRRKVTLLTQEPYLLKRTVRANVAYGLRVRGERNNSDRIQEAMDMVGLKPQRFASRSWHELSGGEAQRVALAARLILKPDVLLLDEPTASLDLESAERIRKASLAARKEWGTTLVIVSHHTDWLESVCDKIIVLEKGRVRSPLPSA